MSSLRFIALTLVAASLLLGTAPTHAMVQTYTNSAAFLLDLPATAPIEDFEGVAAGTVIASGGGVGGLTFVYTFSSGSGERLAVSDGTVFGASGFDTTSGSRALATEDSDVLQEGDDLELGFGAASAVGLFIVSSETPDFTLFDGDIQLGAGTSIASLDVDAVEQILPSGARVYFLGVIDTTAPFTSAHLVSSMAPGGAGAQFLYNVDDVQVLPVPEPGASGLFAGIAGLLALTRARARKENRS